MRPRIVADFRRVSLLFPSLSLVPVDAGRRGLPVRGDLGRPDLAVLPCVARTNGNGRRVWSGLDPDPDIAS